MAKRKSKMTTFRKSQVMKAAAYLRKHRGYSSKRALKEAWKTVP